MADNYCQSSSFMVVPAGKLAKAKEIIDRVLETIGAEEGTECQIAIQEGTNCGVRFHGDEYFDTDHAATVARALVEELEIDEPFYCSWAYTCSKPRTNEFGGGAFVVQRGYQTHWIEASQAIKDFVSSGQLKKK
jgi:hypothetical protein